jgi:hypothetical protein
MKKALIYLGVIVWMFLILASLQVGWGLSLLIFLAPAIVFGLFLGWVWLRLWAVGKQEKIKQNPSSLEYQKDTAVWFELVKENAEKQVEEVKQKIKNPSLRNKSIDDDESLHEALKHRTNNLKQINDLHKLVTQLYERFRHNPEQLKQVVIDWHELCNLWWTIDCKRDLQSDYIGYNIGADKGIWEDIEVMHDQLREIVERLQQPDKKAT